MRDVLGLQNGRPLDLLHFPNVDQHEQAKVNEDQVVIDVQYYHSYVLYHKLYYNYFYNGCSVIFC